MIGDFGYGFVPVYDNGILTGYDELMVSDEYAIENPSYIIGFTELPTENDITIMCTNPPICDDPPVPGITTYRAFTGYGRITRNWDKLIAFDGNGGGSEINIGRISGYLVRENEQVTNMQGDQSVISFSRLDGRYKRWKRISHIWDANWRSDNFEQIYAVYEEDTKGEKTFSGSLSTTVGLTTTVGISANGTRSISYSVKVVTEDIILRQMKIDRNTYFSTAHQDQNFGFDLKNGGSLGFGIL